MWETLEAALGDLEGGSSGGLGRAEEVAAELTELAAASFLGLCLVELVVVVV